MCWAGDSYPSWLELNAVTSREGHPLPGSGFGSFPKGSRLYVAGEQSPDFFRE